MSPRGGSSGGALARRRW